MEEKVGDNGIDRRNIFALGFTSLLTDISSESVYAVLPLYILHLGYGREVVGVVEGLGELASSMFKLISGVVSQKIGRFKLLTAIGYSLSNFIKPLFAIARTPLSISSIKFIDRVGKGIRTSPRDVLITQSSKYSVRGRAFGIHRTMDTIGALIGPLTAFLILPVLGYQGVFILSLVPGSLAILILALFVKERIVQLDRISIKHSVRPELFYLFLLTVVLTGLSGFNQAFLLIRARELGWSEQLVLTLLILANIIYSAIAYPIGRFFDIKIRNLLYPITHLSIIMGSIIAVIMNTPKAPLLFFTIYGLFLALNDVSTRVITSRIVSEKKAGVGFGLMHMSLGLSVLTGNTLLGFIYEKLGYRSAFTYSAVIGLAGLVSSTIFVLLVTRREFSENIRF
ncbi:MAG: MFS transporter [Desulfurococcaceae archaeon]